jgi:hypothetical protein
MRLQRSEALLHPGVGSTHHGRVARGHRRLHRRERLHEVAVRLNLLQRSAACLLLVAPVVLTVVVLVVAIAAPQDVACRALQLLQILVVLNLQGAVAVIVGLLVVILLGRGGRA